MTTRRAAMRRAARQRGSLLTRIIAIFVIVLLTSSSIVAVFETRRNRAALLTQSENLLTDDLAILLAQVRSTQAEQAALLDSVAREIAFIGAVRTGQRHTLTGEVQQIVGTRLFDWVAIVGRSGILADVPAGAVPAVTFEAVQGGVTSVLMPSGDGEPILLVAERIDSDHALVGGTRFGDALGYTLRKLVKQPVLIVANDRVVGSTLTAHPQEPPGWAMDGAPQGVVSVQIDGEPALVAYTRIATVQRGGAELEGWLGVTVGDPLALLDDALLRDRAMGVALLSAIGILLAWGMFRLVTRPVTALTTAATRIAKGDLDHDFSAGEGRGELFDLASALDQMLTTLRGNIATIDDQATHLRSATERMVHARDDERRRVAATLHDGFQQRLVVLRMRLRDLAGQVSTEQVDALADEVLQLLGDLRRLSHDLYPSILRDRGLGPAVHSLVSGSPVAVSVELEPDPLPRLALLIEANAYFLVSEAVTNVLKHAPDATMQVTARVMGHELVVSVIDTGPGFDVRAKPGKGLTGLRDRATAVGGTCQITSDARGTSVVARLPLTDSASLQEEQYGRDPAVEVFGMVESELGEDGAGVLLNGSLGDRQ